MACFSFVERVVTPAVTSICATTAVAQHAADSATGSSSPSRRPRPLLLNPLAYTSAGATSPQDLKEAIHAQQTNVICPTVPPATAEQGACAAEMGKSTTVSKEISVSRSRSRSKRQAMLGSPLREQRCGHCGAVYGEFHVCQSMSTLEIKRALVSGNERYITGDVQFQPDGNNMLHRMQVSSGQAPAVAVIGCADSRCNPQQVCDGNEGELFTTRTAGNYVGTSVAGSIVYACRHLGVKFVLVMGHTKCGAIAAASVPLSPPKRQRVVLAPTSQDVITRSRSVTEIQPGDDPLDFLVGWIRRSLENGGDRFGCHPVEDACDESLVKVQLGFGDDLVCRNVVEQLGILKHVLKEIPDVAIVGSVFHLETGRVDFFDEYVQNGEVKLFSDDPSEEDSST
mmetsp:Transcript_19054/g.47670  ORF Transcript_19054/g.47670 Transcript_19054/m.47670 type:complete len:397 (-) Transcript_19054:1338-2528(-)